MSTLNPIITKISLIVVCDAIFVTMYKLLVICIVASGIWVKNMNKLSFAVRSSASLKRIPPKADSLYFRDTLANIVTDTFFHDLGDTPNENAYLMKYFKYIGADTVKVVHRWTSDPHYICDMPELLIPQQLCSLKVCFAFNHRSGGRWRKTMGFDLSNGKRITFTFSGRLLTKTGE